MTSHTRLPLSWRSCLRWPAAGWRATRWMPAQWVGCCAQRGRMGRKVLLPPSGRWGWTLRSCHWLNPTWSGRPRAGSRWGRCGGRRVPATSSCHPAPTRTACALTRGRCCWSMTAACLGRRCWLWRWAARQAHPTGAACWGGCTGRQGTGKRSGRLTCCTWSTLRASGTATTSRTAPAPCQTVPHPPACSTTTTGWSSTPGSTNM
mmetsp:Transcript_784/g.2100  ORF Transcript_784/g.2100 Transcript_784/m.2100 type:complete len:205 (+) Transcript_784:1232-1846(+)